MFSSYRMMQYYKNVRESHKTHRQRTASVEPLTVNAMTLKICIEFFGMTKKCTVGCDPVYGGSRHL